MSKLSGQLGVKLAKLKCTACIISAPKGLTGIWARDNFFPFRDPSPYSWPKSTVATHFKRTPEIYKRLRLRAFKNFVLEMVAFLHRLQAGLVCGPLMGSTYSVQISAKTEIDGKNKSESLVNQEFPASFSMRKCTNQLGGQILLLLRPTTCAPKLLILMAGWARGFHQGVP